ncbi:MAG TPA: Gfo/Idh/MocA family oxidoreductase, partial [Streptosporangiaceae bacterium]
MAPVSLIVVGAGQRGTGYARWARRHPERAAVVAVAEPSPARRARLAAEHGITPQNAVTDWTELAGRGRLADAVLIC